MKYTRKFTIAQIGTKTIDEEVIVTLDYGRVEGSYYDLTYPKEVFDTEEEAIKYAYEKSTYANWVILPLITFEND